MTPASQPMPSYTPAAQAPTVARAATQPAPPLAGPANSLAWRTQAGRDRRAASPIKAYGSLERAFAACGLIAASGTTGGAVLTLHGYGAAPLLGATSLALLLCACLGIWAQERVIQYQRGEVARVYANAVEAPRRAVFERRRAGPTRVEALSIAMADLVESLRLTVFGGDRVRLWAVSMRRALDDRAEASKTLAAALGEDAHAIAAAATAARRMEADISADMGDVFACAGRAAEATASLADEAHGLEASVRQTTANLRQASILAAGLADNAMNAQRGVVSVGKATMGLRDAAEQVSAVLQRAEAIGAGNPAEARTDMIAEMRVLAATGRQALEVMMQAVRGLTTEAAAMTKSVTVISEGVQAQGALGQALSDAMSHQMEGVAQMVAKAGLAKTEIAALQQRATFMEQRNLGLDAGPAARRAVERLPAHAEAIAKILRDLPSFEPAKT